MLPARFKVSPLHVVVLLHHVTHSEDASNDADRTVEEIIADIDDSGMMLSKGLLESALYCCNMESERGRFWHPLNKSFDTFVRAMLDPKKFHFDRYYNVIYEVRDGAKTPAPESETMGQGT